MTRPLVLLSNDDGYFSQGIAGMRRALGEFADVVVCAPETEQSAMSHSITLTRPLRLVQREESLFSLDGTPADCVYVALHATQRVLSRRPDLVVSGMNHGLNLGNDVFYSGTVAAAREGALRGIPALAVSAAGNANLQAACALAAKLAQALLNARIAAPTLFNANFPEGETWALRATRLGTRTYEDGVVFRRDPRGGEYLWIGTGGFAHSREETSDTRAFDEGVVGVTPLSLTLWNPEQVTHVESLLAALA